MKHPATTLICKCSYIRGHSSAHWYIVYREIVKANASLVHWKLFHFFLKNYLDCPQFLFLAPNNFTRV